MEITKLKWPDNHQILPGLEIPLCDDHGNPYKIIVIAGDNGIGKTTILQSIHDVMSGNGCDFEEFEYKITADKYTAAYRDDEHLKVKKDNGDFHSVQLARQRRNPFDFGEIGEMDDVAPQKFKSYISNASTEFNSSSEADIYTEIKQLLITFERQDNEAYKAKNIELEAAGNPLLSVTSFSNLYSKLEKFKRAFNNVFDDLKFRYIKSDVDETRAIFTKNSNEEIDIDRLSTGEKQIVFRGSSLLHKASDADIILIDEPEISMHPRWMLKMLKFYKDLATDSTTGQLKSQIFIVTHSDLLVKTAVEDNDVHVVRLVKNGNSLSCNKPDDPVLRTTTSAEINYLVFGLLSSDYHIQLFSQLHNDIVALDNRKGSIKSADTSIKGQPQYAAAYRKPYENVQNGHITSYDTLPCYVRNCIDHPDSPDSHGDVQRYTNAELEESIRFLRTLIKAQKAASYDFSK